MLFLLFSCNFRILFFNLQIPNGILSLLDDECLRPDGAASDEFLLRKMGEIFSGRPHFERCRDPSPCVAAYSNDRNADPALDSFILKHYAGSVTYLVKGFVEKNGDLLCRDLSQAMYRCGHSILKQLFPEGNPQRTTLRRPATVASQLRGSVSTLVKNLTTKTPHYIHCIKANDLKTAGLMDPSLVQRQIRYLRYV